MTDPRHPVIERVLSDARRHGLQFGDGPDDIDTGELASDILAALRGAAAQADGGEARETDLVARNLVYAALGRASEGRREGKLTRIEVADIVSKVPRAAQADGGEPPEDEPDWLYAFVLHAEAVHGCTHTAQLREDAHIPTLRAAQADTAPGLTEAWAAAEAALPDGWDDILLMKTDRHGTPGYAATASQPRGEGGAYRIVSTTADGRKPDPTPAAALQALAARLRGPS
jgi:hypothetical protein